jgi:signal transduction histidine kinase/DNA-binding response OmpR family regulator
LSCIIFIKRCNNILQQINSFVPPQKNEVLIFRLRFYIILILLLAAPDAYPQPAADTYNSSGHHQKAIQLFQRFEQEIKSLPFDENPCLLEILKNEQQEFHAEKPYFEGWIKEVRRMAEQGNFDCVFSLLNALEPSAKKEKIKYQQWLYEKTSALTDIENFDSAQVVAGQLRELSKKTPFEGWSKLAESKLNLDKRQFRETQVLAEEALVIARKYQDKALEARALGIIGRVTRDIYMIRPEKNIPFHEAAYKIAADLKDTTLMISELMVAGLSFDGTKEIYKELDYIEQGFNLLNANTSLKNRIDCVRLLAFHLENIKEYDKAIPLYDYSLRLSKKLRDRSMVRNLYEGVAGSYARIKNYDKALAMMDSAGIYINEYKELGYFYSSYADIALAKGDRDLAIKYYQRAFKEQVTGYTNRNSALLTEMETRFRTREKELELEQQQRKRWIWLGLAAALSLLLLIVFYAYWIQRKSGKKIAHQKSLIEEQAEALRHLDRVKSNFFANVSHELRTPLTLMLGPIGSVLKRNKLENHDFTLLKLAQTHGKTLISLINQILDLSKIESHKMELNETSVLLYSFLRRITAAFESHAGRLGLNFYFQYEPDKNLQVLLDTNKMETILNNLLSNAMKFTPQGGMVSVKVEDDANLLRLTVTDSGRGIHSSDINHVFDRFYQTSQPGAAAEGGTGIGLALSRELAELMKGKIRVESEIGKGSAFFLEIPKKEVMGVAATSPFEQEITTEIPSLLIPETKKADAFSLLIVEDNSSLRDYLQLILSPYYQVITKENGQLALDFLQQKSNNGDQWPIEKKVHLIISDIMMPVMDGFQLLQAVKNDDRLRHLPFILLTARADSQDKLRALRTGVDDYLLKPFEEDELLARVDNLLRNFQHRFDLTDDQMADNLPETSHPVTAEVAAVTSVAEMRFTREDLEWLESLENLVDQHLKNANLTADTLADLLALSRASFFRQVKRLTGLTPAQYLDEARFSKARFLLENNPGMQVKEVAFKVGFLHVQHFSKRFRERYGKYPSEYLNA